MGGARLRILVIEDDELDRTAVRRCLVQSGLSATVDEAASAREALERVGGALYDCVLLDYYIPGAHGLSLLEGIRSAAPGVPLVILTGRGDEEVAVELMKAGAADYLPKASVTPERLASSVRHAIELAHAARVRRQAEAELREQEARFRALANLIPQLAWMTDADGAIVWFNQRWLDYTGMTPEAMQGWGWQQLHHRDHLQRVVDGFRRAFAAGEPWEDTFPLRGRDGGYRWFLSRAVPVRREDGTVLGWFGTNTDITERLEAEHAVRESEERLRHALEIDTVGVVFVTMDGTITGANDAFLRLAGYAREEAVAGRLRWDALTPPEWSAPSRRAVEALETSGRAAPYETEYVRKDGSRGWALVTATRISPAEGVAFVIDITEQKRAEVERERLLGLERDARGQAERAIRARDEVLAVVAHDLRNPIHSATSAAALLAQPLEEPQRRRSVEIIQRAMQDMDRLIGDLLDVARIESGTFTVRTAEIEVRPMLDGLLDRFRAASPRRPRQARLRDRARGGARHRRPRRAHPGAVQPPRQRRQVQPARRPGHGPRRPREGDGADLGGGLGTGRRPRGPRPDLRPVLARRAQLARRHGPRARHLQGHRRGARRPHLGREPARARGDVPRDGSLPGRLAIGATGALSYTNWVTAHRPHAWRCPGRQLISDDAGDADRDSGDDCAGWRRVGAHGCAVRGSASLVGARADDGRRGREGVRARAPRERARARAAPRGAARHRRPSRARRRRS